MMGISRKGKIEVDTGKALCSLTALYFFVCYFEAYLNRVIGSLMKFFIFGLVLIYVWKYKGRIAINFISISYILWLGYKCVTLLWTRSYYMFELHIVAHIGIIMLVTCIVARPLGNKMVQYLIGSLWIGSFLIGFISLFSHTAYLGVFAARQVLMLFGVVEDPNNQAAFLLFGISIAAYFIVVERKYLILGILTIFVNMMSLMMTASRGGFIAALLIVIVIVLLMTDNLKTKVWAISVIIVGAFIILRYAGNYVSSASWDRLMIAEGYEGGSGRVDKWMNTIHLINQNPLYYIFGAGWGANWGYRGLKAGVHNSYLSHFCDTGIIGIIMFHYPIIKCIKELWERKRYLPIVVSLSGLIPAAFLDSINKRYFWNALLFLFICYMNYQNEKECLELTEIT